MVYIITAHVSVFHFIAFLLEANPIRCNIFSCFCSRSNQRRGCMCANQHTERRSLVELRWRRVGEEAVDLSSGFFVIKDFYESSYRQFSIK